MSDASAFNCPNCGAPLELDPRTDLVIRCPYCHGTVVIPETLRIADSPISIRKFAVDMDLDALVQQAVDLAEVSQLVAGRKKIEAIQRFRELTGAGLDEAMEAVNALERGEPVELVHRDAAAEISTSDDTYDSSQVVEEIRALSANGQKIQAIKLYRETFGTGLKESKEAVEALESGLPLPVPDRPGSAGQPIDSMHDLMDKATALSQIAGLVEKGQKIEAVKRYREVFDVSLVEAKTAVERIEAKDYSGLVDEVLETVYISQVSTSPTNQAMPGKVIKAAGVGFSCLWLFIIAITVVSIGVPIFLVLTQPGAPLEWIWQRVNPFTSVRPNLRFGGEGTGPGLFEDARQIAIDNQGHIYVADYNNGRVQRFDDQGNYLSLWRFEEDSYVSGLAADRTGTVYVVYGGNVWRFDGETGRPLGVLENEVGFSTGVYYEDIAVLADGGLIAIKNSEDLVRFDNNRQIVWVVEDAISNAAGESELDAKLAVDGLNHAYMLGTFRYAVFRFSPEGRYLNRFGSNGDQAGQFRSPSSLAVDGRGYIYVADIQSIKIFAPDGRFLETIPVSSYIYDLAISDTNELYTLSNTSFVQRYTLPDSWE